MAQQPLLHELIHIPESLHKGDFVLKLGEGVGDAEATLNQYVVTPALRDNFQRALGQIDKAVRDGKSQATYLDGSFGSGKSHFMAVLHLLLENDLAARSKAELAPVIARHEEWLGKKKFLLLPFHMIDRESFRATVLGEYAERIAEKHPEAARPGVYRAEGLLEDADRWRQRIGDEDFFAALGTDEAASGGWGKLETSWNAESYEQARAQQPGEPERQALIAALVRDGGLFESYASVVEGQGEAFVETDVGLATISRHAKSLGYDAIILFLDELILWLASRVADQAFVERQLQSIVKLVEAGDADRPAPLISFVARQRDLSELVGEHVPGVQKVRFKDLLRYWEGRFDKISFQDRDLAEIAEKRILRPRSEAARQQIDAAFEQTWAKGSQAREVWLGQKGDRDQFRKVYPFSPALLDTLVALSSMLQRERTAIKVMMQLLVDRRDTLRLGELIPLGDLYDAIAQESDPFTDELRELFDAARKLYRRKLEPMLQREHGISADEVSKLGEADPKRRAWRGHERLLKTLLLAALAPQVEAFQGLTARRLVALNHGSISSAIPGQESSDALQLCRRWASMVPELRVGTGSDPQISLQISGVDTTEILDRVALQDNDGSRQKRLRELLFDALGLSGGDLSLLRHTTIWRGTERSFDIAFGNVRTMTAKDLQASDDAWKIVFDYPFDVGNHTARDDLSAIEKHQQELVQRTVVWLPSFWSNELRRQLGELVRIDYLLRGTALEENTAHLSVQDRQQARQLLENQQDQLRARLSEALEEAFGIRSASTGTLTEPLQPEEQLQSLSPTFRPQRPAATNLADGLEKLVDQICSHQHPSHPRFAEPVRPAAVRAAWEILQRVRDENLERIEVEKKERQRVRQVVEPLQLAEVHETVLVPRADWFDHFSRREAQAREAGELASCDGGPLPAVRDLRAWMTDETPLGSGDPGLPRLLQDLVMLDFAGAARRQLMRQGVAVDPQPGKLPDDAVLRPQKLPTEATWKAANDRAQPIFGTQPGGYLSQRNVAALARRLQDAARQLGVAEELKKELQKHLADWKVPDDCDRAKSVGDAIRLLSALETGDDVERIARLAEVELESTPIVVGKAIKSAGGVLRALAGCNWKLLQGATSSEHGEAGQQVAAKVAAALSHHEIALPLGEALETAEALATSLVTGAKVPDPPVKPVPGSRNAVDLSLDAARRKLDEIEAEAKGRSVRIDLGWSFDE